MPLEIPEQSGPATIPTSIGYGFLGTPNRVQRCPGAPRRPVLCVGAPRRLARCGTVPVSEYAIYMTAAWTRRFNRTAVTSYNSGALGEERNIIPGAFDIAPSFEWGNLFNYSMRGFNSPSRPVQIGRHWLIESASDFYTPSTGSLVSYRNAPGTILRFNRNIDSAHAFADGVDTWFGGHAVGYPQYFEDLNVNGTEYPTVLRLGVWVDMFEPIMCCVGDADEWNTACVPVYPDTFIELTDCEIYEHLPNCFRAGTPIEVGTAPDDCDSSPFGFNPYIGTALGDVAGYSSARYPEQFGRSVAFLAAYLMFDDYLASPFDGELPNCVGGFLDIDGTPILTLGDSYSWTSPGNGGPAAGDWMHTYTLTSRNPGSQFTAFLPETYTQTGSHAYATNTPVDVTQETETTAGACGGSSYSTSDTIEDVLLHGIQINVVPFAP